MRKKLEWQCRRGMLELDMILQPFLENFYHQMKADEQDAFVELLSEADPDLFTWIMGFGECDKHQLLPIISLIRNKMSVA